MRRSERIRNGTRLFSSVIWMYAAITLLHADVLAIDPPSSRLPVVEVRAPNTRSETGQYQQPRWVGSGRFSSTTDVYVQDPWRTVLDVNYELTVPRHGRSSHLFTEELELGLPFRLQIAYENQWEVKDRRAQVRTQNFEMRWSPANWGKIPLNPTLFLEYKIGVGKETEVEAESADAEEREAKAEPKEDAEHKESADGGGRSRDIPDSVEVRLLLAQQFGAFQWALNLFHEQETGGDREMESGFSQAIMYPVLDESLGVGVEMQFIRRTKRETRNDPTYEFDIGPAFTAKLGNRVQFDVAALFGTTDDSPAVNLFAIFTIDFGPPGEKETSAPVSTRNR